MHLDYNDPVEWLAHRYKCDEDARNKHIEKQFVQYFSDRKELNLLDAGAGTGNNFRYYFERLNNQRQSWTLLEHDPDIINACRTQLKRFAKNKGYKIEQGQDSITVKSNTKQAHINFVEGKLDDIQQIVDMESLDTVTANALFDLVTYDQFDVFASKLACYQVCLLATLNYYETSFLPFSEADARYIRYFHMHMTRPQSFGAAMGPNCSGEMIDLLAAHEMKTDHEASQWHLKRYDTTMQHYILHFFEHAIRDLNLSKTEIIDLKAWIDQKKEASQQHKLEIVVDHSDIFAYP